MAKKIQLSIPKPCHESWDAMTPVEKGKFCGSCQKQVVDFSNMSDRQVAEFFKKPSTGSVCGRFMTDQLERDIEIPKKRIPWFKYFFQFALPAFLFSMKASAQQTKGKIKVNTVTKDTTSPVLRPKMGLVAPICRPQLMGDISIERPALSGSLELKIVDEKGSIIPYASIETGVIGKGGAANKDGLFKLDKSILKMDGKIFVSAGGFERKEVLVKTFSHITGTFTVTLQKKGWLEEVVVTSYTVKPERYLTGVTTVRVEQLYTTIKGKVVDENNNPIPYASVMIKGTRTGTTADEKGLFKISSSGEACTLVGSAVSFETSEVLISKNSFSDTAIIRLTTNRHMMVGELVIINPNKKVSKTIPVIPDNSGNKTVQAFKVFPNPVDAGTSLNIEWKQTEEGYYSLQLLSESGQSVYQQEIWIDADAKLLSIDVPEVAAGNYFVVFTSKKTGKKFSEKIIIQ